MLAANPKFFKVRRGLRAFEVEFVPNEDTAVNLLRTHAIDYIYQPSIQTYPSLRGASRRPHRLGQHERLRRHGAEPLARRTCRPRVRTAIAAAIDKTALTRQLTYGQETIATEDIPDWMWAFDPSVQSVPFDPARAKALLASAGWIAGADGIARKDGRPLELLLVDRTRRATDRSESLLIQAALRRIGIAVERQVLPHRHSLRAAGMGGIHARRQVRSPRLPLVCRHRSRQLVAVHVRELSAARLQRSALLQRARWTPRRPSPSTHYDRATRKRAYSTDRASALGRQSDGLLLVAAPARGDLASTSTASRPTPWSSPGMRGNGVSDARAVSCIGSASQPSLEDCRGN